MACIQSHVSNNPENSCFRSATCHCVTLTTALHSVKRQTGSNTAVGSQPVVWHVVKDLHHQDDSRPLIWKLPGKRAGGILLKYSEVLVVLVAMRDFLLLHSCQVGADLHGGVACARVHLGMVCLKVVLDNVLRRFLAISKAVPTEANSQSM